MRPITVWYCQNRETKRFEHNHIQDGHVDGSYPIPMFESQKVWINQVWKYIHAYLNSKNIIIKKEEQGCQNSSMS